MKQKRYAGAVLLVLALVATVFYLFPLVLVAINSVKTRANLPATPSACPPCSSGATTAMPLARCTS